MSNHINPWEVTGNTYYLKLVKEFGTQLIDDTLIKRFELVTGHKVHPLIKRGVFFSHRELELILNDNEQGKPILLYTGRGPSSDNLHIGHTTSYEMVVWLQSVFNCHVVIQISDDEKCAFKNISFDTIYKYGYENARDLVAFGFNPNKTFIFSNRDYRLTTPIFENFVYDLQCNTSAVDLRSIFGFDNHLKSRQF